MSNKLTTFEQFKMLGNRVKTFVDNSISNLAGLTSTAISDLQNGKQDKLTGKEGQIVGFNNVGNVVNYNGPINENLIDNPNYKVNQRSQTSYTAQGYTVDRWRLAGSNCSVTVLDNGIEVLKAGTDNPTISQLIENPKQFAGQIVTLSALFPNNPEGVFITDGVGFSSTHQDVFVAGKLGSWTFTVSDNPIENSWVGFWVAGTQKVHCQAMKLELGDRQTLAHQDSSGNWVLNEIPNYALELAKCQRYMQIFLNSSMIGDSYSRGNDTVTVMIPLTTALRANPSINNDAFITFDNFDISTAPSSIKGYKMNNCLNVSITMPVNVPSNVGHCYVAWNSPKPLILDANL